MNICCWNIRGLSDSCKQYAVTNLVKDYNINIIGLVENKVKIENVQSIFKKCLPGWNSFHNGSGNDDCRVWFCGNPQAVKVSLADIHPQIITCSFEYGANAALVFISFVYAEYERDGRVALWR
ncbi:hypothetical protein ACH5RR_032640 [Cinchona calisaya]|uniref:Uncharacterized protein n=1 Tax=Cinchona calisaya TaxID=153742 RepID=A0ABD2YNY5_9GENT